MNTAWWRLRDSRSDFVLEGAQMHNDRNSTSLIDLTPPGAQCLQLVMDWQMIAVRGALLAQGLQWEAMGAWQRSVAAVRRELLDQWICRFGGGVPLDG